MLSDKVAIITGRYVKYICTTYVQFPLMSAVSSSSGIGAQIAKEFAKNGALVVIHGRNEKGLEETKQSCLSCRKREQNVCSLFIVSR